MNFTHEANPVRVYAWQIDHIQQPTSEEGLVAVSKAGDRQVLEPAMIARYMPVPGDYIVLQEDSYVYVNPKDVFERKYHPI